MSDGGNEENAGGLSSTQLEQLESTVMERLLARLFPGSREEPLPTTEVEGELRAVHGSWVPGGYSRAQAIVHLEPAIGHTAGMWRSN